MGFDGVELGGDVVGNEAKFENALKNAKVKVSAVCWGSRNGDSSRPTRTSARTHGGHEARAGAAGRLKSTGVIFVPAFNGQTTLTNQDIRSFCWNSSPPWRSRCQGGHAHPA